MVVLVIKVTAVLCDNVSPLASVSCLKYNFRNFFVVHIEAEQLKK